MKTSRLSQAILCLSLALAIFPASAQQNGDVHPSMTSKFRADLGVYGPKRGFTIQVDGNLDEQNLPYELSRGIGHDDRDPLLNAEFGWRFKDKWALSAQYFSASGTGQSVLEDTVEWKDIEYPIGATVRVGADFAVARIFVSRHFLQQENHALGIGLGVHWLNVGVQIEGQAFLADLTSEFRRESVAVTAPLPNIGAWYRYSTSRNWMLSARADWLDVTIGEVGGGLLNLRVGADYSFSDHFGMSLNYQFLRINVDVEKRFWRGQLIIDYRGPAITFNAYW